MNEFDYKALKERGEIVQKINAAGPTARELVDAFGEDSLFVETAFGEVPGYVDAQGLVMPRGRWRVAIARPDFSPERNRLRIQLFQAMCEKKRALQTEDMERKHDTTDHVLWTDAEGIERAAPAETADAVISKSGVEHMTHPKVWRPS